MNSDGFWFDRTNPKYRQFKRGDDILEYTREGIEITVDWVSGKHASSMIKTILEAEGEGVMVVSGYVTDKLGDVTHAVLERFSNQLANQLGGGWSATVQMIEGRRYLTLTKREP